MTKTAAKATRSSRPSIPAKAAVRSAVTGPAGHRGLESVSRRRRDDVAQRVDDLVDLGRRIDLHEDLGGLAVVRCDGR